MLAPPTQEPTVPDDVKRAGYSHSLGAHVAKEVLAVFADKRGSDDERVRLPIDYAENDAYPDWVYDR